MVTLNDAILTYALLPDGTFDGLKCFIYGRVKVARSESISGGARKRGVKHLARIPTADLRSSEIDFANRPPALL
jgi:hypothetical protein